MMKQHIFGTLTPTVGATPRTRQQIYDAVDAVKLFTVISHQKWDEGIIEIDNVSLEPVTDQAPLDFIARLHDMLWRVGVTELGLSGEITITVTGAQPVIYRVIVENSELRYQKADTFNWEETVTPSHAWTVTKCFTANK